MTRPRRDRSQRERARAQARRIDLCYPIFPGPIFQRREEWVNVERARGPARERGRWAQISASAAKSRNHDDKGHRARVPPAVAAVRDRDRVFSAATLTSTASSSEEKEDRHVRSRRK